MELSPIVLFTYNRPWHTQQVLDALARNKEAEESLLYIYCDGPKQNATENTLKDIQHVRTISHSEKRFNKVIIIESAINKGLANAIIEGVTAVIEQHGKVIVLEDDIVPSSGFLQYMNGALTLYEANNQVGCIHAWNYHLKSPSYVDTTFFLKGADCWGWATWARSWKLFNPNGQELLEQINKSGLSFEFNRRNTHPFISMLEQQIRGENNSWAIRWHASLFLADNLCLHPLRPIVKNIGLDNSGTHCGDYAYLQEPIEFINLTKIDIKEADWFFDAYLHQEVTSPTNGWTGRWKVFKSYLKRLLT